MVDTVNPQSPPLPVLPVPKYIFNMDLIDIINRLSRFVTEFVKSVSSNVDVMPTADVTKFNSYFDNFDKKIDSTAAGPELDLSHTSEIPWPVEPLIAVPSILNEDIESLVRHMMVLYTELLTCTSSNRPAGISVLDAKKLKDINQKARQYLAGVSPALDLPMTSTLDAVTPR